MWRTLILMILVNEGRGSLHRTKSLLSFCSLCKCCPSQDILKEPLVFLIRGRQFDSPIIPAHVVLYILLTLTRWLFFSMTPLLFEIQISTLRAMIYVAVLLPLSCNPLLMQDMFILLPSFSKMGFFVGEGGDTWMNKHKPSNKIY